MKLHILSDLHNEFGEYVPSQAALEADVVVLAGDIDVGTRGLEWADKAFSCPVLYVPGNHEFYHHHMEHMLETMRNYKSDKVTLLDMNEVIISGVRFLGAITWTNFLATGDEAIASLSAKQRLHDFKYISTDSGKIQPADMIKISNMARSWLRSKLEEKFHGKTVVITHHAPLMRSLEHSPHPKSHLEAAFANCWDDLFKNGIGADLWIHGHTHINTNYVTNKTRVISNQRGYPGEDTLFNPDFVVDL